MSLPENVDPNQVMNPATGLLYRNPTHLAEGKRSQNQSEIVKQVMGAGRETVHDILDYSNPDVTELPGFKKFMSLTEEEIHGLCKSLLRSRPNIYSFRVSLGNYTTKKLDNVKTKDLGANRPRFQTEIAETLAGILSDKNLCVVDVIYTIQNHTPGRFMSVAEVYSTTKEEYANLENFAPVVEREYFPNA